TRGERRRYAGDAGSDDDNVKYLIPAHSSLPVRMTSIDVLCLIESIRARLRVQGRRRNPDARVHSALGCQLVAIVAGAAITSANCFGRTRSNFSEPAGSDDRS